MQSLFTQCQWILGNLISKITSKQVSWCVIVIDVFLLRKKSIQSFVDQHSWFNCIFWCCFTVLDFQVHFFQKYLILSRLLDSIKQVKCIAVWSPYYGQWVINSGNVYLIMIAYQLFTWHKSNYTHTFGVKSVGHGIQFKGAINFFINVWKAEEIEIKKLKIENLYDHDMTCTDKTRLVLGTKIKNKTTHFIERNSIQFQFQFQWKLNKIKIEFSLFVINFNVCFFLQSNR